MAVPIPLSVGLDSTIKGIGFEYNRINFLLTIDKRHFE